MKQIRVCMMVLALLAGSAHAAGVALCSPQLLLGHTPNGSEVKTHRQFAAPVISYPYGTKLDQWGWRLTVRVDEAGRVVCYGTKDEFDRDFSMNEARRAFLDKLGSWRYASFAKNGRPTAVVLSEHIAEQESPKTNRPLPDVRLAEVHIALARSGCFGSCPSYQIDIHGDGRVVYQGGAYVDVVGRHEYKVPKVDVAKLVESLRAKGIWSLRSSYRAPITDNPDYELTLTIDGQTHKLDDYVGQMAGMPAVVSDFENEVDEVARSGMWVNLSQAGIEHLKAEGFRFDSPEGADLLARTVANRDSHDDEAMRELVKLGAPLDGSAFVAKTLREQPGSVVEEALRNHRSLALIDALIIKGALGVNGHLDQDPINAAFRQEKIDAAFRAAIVGGRLALMQRIWAIRGTRPHPSLDYEDTVGNVSKRFPVTLLLSKSYDDVHWEGLASAKWLAAQGCDLKVAGADARTLLHIAAAANDADFVRYMLHQGVSASTPGEYGLPALGSTTDEDVALILLKAGTDFSRMDDAGQRFRSYAESNHWQRVVTWLNTHHKS